MPERRAYLRLGSLHQLSRGQRWRTLRGTRGRSTTGREAEALCAGAAGRERPCPGAPWRAVAGRTPVREALALLQHEGLLAPRNGRGLYVRPVSRDEFIAKFSANEVVEPYLVRRATLLATNEMIAEMRSVLEREEQIATSGNMPAFFPIGRDRHRLIGQASGNAPSTRFVQQNEEHADLYLLDTGQDIGTPRMRSSNEEHHEILDAIARRDPDQAAQLVIVHSQLIHCRVADFYEETAPERS